MKKYKSLRFITLIAALLVLFFISLNLGSIKVTPVQLFKGLFVSFDEKVAYIYDLRFPRIFIALLAGAAISVSGVLLQSILKNPLADPSIIGISSGAGCLSFIVVAFFPSLYFQMPLIACIGGVISALLIFYLAKDSNYDPLRIILIGIAINAMFLALSEVFESFSGGNQSGVASIANANISLKTWSDVGVIFSYLLIPFIITIILSDKTNMFALEDKSAKSIGVNIEAMRLVVLLFAVILASVSTAMVGVISFLGLIVPHIGRLIIGNDNKFLIPFSMILGAFVLLLADTIGRVAFSPYEISASIIMSMIGAPCFLILLKRSVKVRGK